MRLCSIEDCGKKHYGRGFCKSHYRKAYPDKKPEGICIIDGCNEHQQRRGYCTKHYYRFNIYGDARFLTWRDRKNDYQEIGNTVEIILRNKAHNEVARAIIDIDDKEKTFAHKWYLNQNGYTCSETAGYLHSFISGKDRKGVVVDHINNNTLDNRKGNLRICSNGVNIQRAGLFKSNTSGYRGAYYIKRLGLWAARIKKDGVQYSLKYHKTKEDAARAYNKKALELFGEHACLNTIQ